MRDRIKKRENIRMRIKKIRNKGTPESLGARIRKARKKAKLSQEQMSQFTGLPQGTISKIETGWADVSVSRLFLVISALNVKLDLLQWVKGEWE